MKIFNVRTYGVCTSNSKVLLSLENFKNKRILKFPGGGLEYGEGLIACLKREWKEELNCEIEVTDHFYTTDYFQLSAWDDSQIISIYYKIHLKADLQLPFSNGNESFDWHPINSALEDLLTLPIDKIVGKKLHELSSQ